MKEVGTTSWKSSNIEVTNESLFTALPGGYFCADAVLVDIAFGGVPYLELGSFGNWWSITEIDENDAWCRTLGYDGSYVGRGGGYKPYGFSVRCVRD